MYEIRQKKRNEMRQKKWFSYALLAIAIFLFSQGSSLIRTNMGYALPAILLSFILHAGSVGNLTERIFRLKPSAAANTAMIAALSVVTIVCYFNALNIFHIVLLNFAAIAVYVIAAAMKIN